MSEMHFLRPEWFLALLPLIGLLWFQYHRKQSGGNWRQACDQQLLPYLLVGEKVKRKIGGLLLIGFAGLLAITALAGPVWEQMEQPVFQQSSSLVIALDLSLSMDAADIKPTRLTRAKHKLSDILQQRREGQTALLVYAAQAFVVSPLTNDTQTTVSQLGSLSTSIMPNQGSRPDRAIEKALQLFQQAGVHQGTILLITDGVEQNDQAAIVSQLPDGINLSVLAVGTEEGAPVTLSSGGFLKDADGQIVVPKLEANTLQQLANEGKGQYARLSDDERDIKYLLEPLASHTMTQGKQSQLQAEQWHEEGPWLLLLLLPIAALAFRRGYLVVLLALLIPLPEPVYATEWDNLWLRADQQADQLMTQGEHAQAADTFINPEWKAAAQYRAGQFTESAKTLDGIDSTRANYNRGNALARAGEIEAAIAAYDTAIEQDAENHDAEENREILKELLKEQQQDQDQQQQNNQNQQDQKDQKDGEENKDQQDGEDQQGDQQQSDKPQDSENKQQQEQENPEQNNEQEDQKNAEQQADQKEGEEETDAEPQEQSAEQVPPLEDEEQRAAEQWLRQVPDDPGGLLRRKFQYQYQQEYQGQTESKAW